MTAEPRHDLLQIPGLVIKSVRRSQFNYLIVADVERPPRCCPECGSSDHLLRHGSRPKTYRDTNVHDKKCRVEVHRQRWRCGEPQCKHIFISDVLGMDSRHAFSTRLVNQIKREALRYPFRKVAADVGCDEATVRKMFNEHVEFLNKYVEFETPEWMGIDEVHIQREYICVITNLHQRTVVNLLEEKSREVLCDYLARIPDRQRIRLVSTDLDAMYHAAVRKLLPDATMVIDRFHLVARATAAVSKLIDQIRCALPEDESRELQRDRWALLKWRNRPQGRQGRQDSPSKQTRKSRTAKKRAEQDRLPGHDDWFEQGWTIEFPQLGRAHSLLQEFYTMWECKTPHEASLYFDEWRKRVPRDLRETFGPLLTTFTRRRADIFSYFGTRLTNAYTEQSNRKIRDINRLGRGYTFDALRAKTLYSSVFKLSPRYHKPEGAEGMEESESDHWMERLAEWQEERHRLFPAPPEHIYRYSQQSQQSHQPLITEKEPALKIANGTKVKLWTPEGDQLPLFSDENGDGYVNYGVPISKLFEKTSFDFDKPEQFDKSEQFDKFDKEAA